MKKTEKNRAKAVIGDAVRCISQQGTGVSLAASALLEIIAVSSVMEDPHGELMLAAKRIIDRTKP